jgi:hypothetical protein
MDQDKRRTLDDLRRCAGKLPLPAVLHLVKSYKATRLTEVPEAAYVDFIDHCELMVSTAEMTPPAPLAAELGLFCRLC